MIYLFSAAKIKQFFQTFVLCAVFLLISKISFAELPDAFSSDPCIPGIPCIVEFTENDPDDDDDGPNAPPIPATLTSPAVPGAPNYRKAEGNDACNADLMNQIYAKAYLEAERQTVMADLLIRKPDSVLEYTCFNRMASLVATKAAPIFTETRDWINRTVSLSSDEGNLDRGGEIDTVVIPSVLVNVFMGTLRVDTAIENVVLESLKIYLDSNFDHDFLGGSLEGIAYDTDNIDRIYNGNYNCAHMNQIYMFAKCVNFMEDDFFWNFNQLASFDPDPRIYPRECADGTDITTGVIAVSENEGGIYVEEEKATPTYRDKMLPTSNCRQDVTPVPTGVMVKYVEKYVDALTGDVTVVPDTRDTYQEMVCPNPGCYYDKNSNRCEN